MFHNYEILKPVFSIVCTLYSVKFTKWLSSQNCDPKQPWEVKVGFMNRFMLEMMYAGHQEHFRQKVAEIAVKKYQGMLQSHLDGDSNMYRNKEERQAMVIEKGGKTTKNTWFRDKGNFTSTVNVLPTPSSNLAKTIKKAIEDCPAPKGTKAKITENGGITVRQDLCRSDPFPKVSCERPGCGLCQSDGSHGQCWKPNVGYRYDCARCRAKLNNLVEGGATLDDMTVYQYVGESSRTAYTRHLQHIARYRTAANGWQLPTLDDGEEKAGSFMWNHTRDEHGGEVGLGGGGSDYNLCIEGRFKDCMTRQVDEDVRLRESGWGMDDNMQARAGCVNSGPKCVLLNGNGDYFKPKSVRTQFRQM